MRQQIRQQSPNRQYVTLNTAFDFFNRQLFEGRLPPAIITLQRQWGAKGYYSADRFENRINATSTADEIALNPSTFAGCTDADILSTLVHEMVHLWQRHFGTPGRGRYHNSQWAAKMEVLGLMPSSTGERGSQRVGDSMTHYIVPGGSFALACEELLADGMRLQWQSRDYFAEVEPPSGGEGSEPFSWPRPNRSKTRYCCRKCRINIWGKPGLHVRCGDCKVRLIENRKQGIRAVPRRGQGGNSLSGGARGFHRPVHRET
jgi:hypothetical protein